jgi:glycosyltransferase involved in cell wall biosynthesis
VGELVLIAGRDPTRHAGGAESYMIGQALAAQRAGYAPHVFTLGRRTETVQAGFGVVHRVATPARPILAYSAFLHRPWLLPALLEFLRGRPGSHVIHAHSGWAWIAAEASARLNAAGQPTRTVASFYATVDREESAKARGAVVRASARRRLTYGLLVAWVRAVSVPTERRGYLAADVIMVNYDTVRRLLIEAYGERAGIQRLAYAAPAAFRDDDPPANRARDTDRPPLIVAVSRHSARKGLDVLIRALAGLRDGGVEFRAALVGGGKLLAAHRSLVRELGLAAQVSLPGVVPDPSPYLRACDVFVLPSTGEGGSGSVSVLEALQAGAPIISSAVDGIPEDLTHDRDALLVAPGSAAALRDALARMLADDSLRERLSRGARATYEARFAAEPAAVALARVYSSLGLDPRLSGRS